MSETDSFAIALYVPDATVRALREDSGLRGLILFGAPELDFLPPPWWEGSHTARLGLIQVQGAGAQESDGNTCGEAWREGPEPKRSAAFSTLRSTATEDGQAAATVAWSGCQKKFPDGFASPGAITP